MPQDFFRSNPLANAITQHLINQILTPKADFTREPIIPFDDLCPILERILATDNSKQEHSHSPDLRFRASVRVSLCDLWTSEMRGAIEFRKIVFFTCWDA